MMFFKKIKNTIIIFLSLFISMPQTIFAYSDYIIASGENVGIKINSNGILVVGLYEINNTYPAKDQGIKIGDLIITANDKKVTNIDELVKELEKGNDTIKIGYIRNNKEENTRLSALRDTLLPKLMKGEIDVSKVDISSQISTDKLSLKQDDSAK